MGNRSNLLVKLGAPAAAPALPLTNIATGKQVTPIPSKDNTVIYKDVEPGSWRLCPTSGGAVTNVALATLDDELSTGTIAAGTGLVMASAAAIGLSSSGDSDSSTTHIAPGSTTTAAAPAPAAPSASAAGSTQVRIKEEDAGDCFIGEDDEIVPVSPFS